MPEHEEERARAAGVVTGAASEAVGALITTAQTTAGKLEKTAESAASEVAATADETAGNLKDTAAGAADQLRDVAASEAEVIRQEAAALTVTLQGLSRQLGNLVTLDQVETKEETKRIRRRVIGTISASVVLALVLSVTGNNVAITRCFFTGDRLGHSATCNVLFPGYNKSVDQGNTRLDQFETVLAEIAKNSKANADQNTELIRLAAILDKMLDKLAQIDARTRP